jgi:hypothetical protein
MFCPQNAFMCFISISEQTAIISFYKINFLVFITETDHVYCAVGTESLNIVQVNLSLRKVKLQLSYEEFSIRPYSCIQILVNWLYRKMNLLTKIFIIIQDRRRERRDCYTTLLQSITNNNTLLVDLRKWEGIIIDFKQGHSSIRPQGYFRKSKTRDHWKTHTYACPDFAVK